MTTTQLISTFTFRS